MEKNGTFTGGGLDLLSSIGNDNVSLCARQTYCYRLTLIEEEEKEEENLSQIYL